MRNNCRASPAVPRLSGQAERAGRRDLADMGRRIFKIVLIKPSHYDADGYVIQWWRSTIPSNSLASVYGLLSECAAERVLGSAGILGPPNRCVRKIETSCLWIVKRSNAEGCPLR